MISLQFNPIFIVFASLILAENALSIPLEAETEAETGYATSHVTAKDCYRRLKEASSLGSFKTFADQFIRSVNDETLSRDEADKCVGSADGLHDVSFMLDIVRQLPKVHSVCEAEFIDQIIALSRQLKANIRYGTVTGSKKTNKLVPFLRLFSGQVVLTCKRSLLDKLEESERSNKQLKASLGMIWEQAVKVENGKKSMPKRMSDLAVKFYPKLAKSVEYIVLAEFLRPTADAEVVIGYSVRDVASVYDFVKIQEACQLIENYARNSVYAITRLAWQGFTARSLKDGDQNENFDKVIEESVRASAWIKVIQHCQGVLIARVHVNTNQELPLDLQYKLVDNEQIVTLEVNKVSREESADKCRQEQTGDGSSRPTCAVSKGHRFDQVETFDEFEDGISAYAPSRGIRSSLARRMSSNQRSLAKHLRVIVYDDEYRKSLMRDYEDGESVALAGTAARGMTTKHHFVCCCFSAHPMPLWETFAIIGGVLVGGFLFILGYLLLCSWLNN